MDYPYESLGTLDEGISVPALSSHMYSPYSVPIKYENEAGRFYCTPTIENGDGWGKPFIDENGDPIRFGTLGGEHITKTLFQREKEWKAHHRGGYHKFGEIDWRGAEVEGVRQIISYHGTSGRHIHDGFIYGSDPKHNNIYYRGKILAVAPSAVLGASLYLDSNNDYWVVAVIDVGLGEFIYRKVHTTVSLAFAADNYDDLSARFRDSKPYGWRSAGVISVQLAGSPLKATTPFFASETGLSFAQCRNTLMTYNNDKEEVEEVAVARIQAKLTVEFVESKLVMTLGVQTATGEQDRYKYYLSANKGHDPAVYTTPAYSVSVSGIAGTPAKMTAGQLTELVHNACPPWSVTEHSDLGNFSDYDIGSPQHNWVCSDISAVARVDGTVPFGVEYIGDTLIEINIKAERFKYCFSQWAMGVDGHVKYGSYTNNRLVLAPDLGGAQNKVGEGISNTSPTVLMVTGGTSNYLYDTIAPPYGTVEHAVWAAAIIGGRSDGIKSLDGANIGEWSALELAYNSGHFPVKTGIVDLATFNQHDGSTQGGIAYKVNHRLIYSVAGLEREIPLSVQDVRTVADHEANTYEDGEGIISGFMVRDRTMHYLDIRGTHPFHISSVKEVDISEIYDNKIGVEIYGEAKGENRTRIEVKIPELELIKVYTDDAEAIDSKEAPLTTGWTYYPTASQPEPMAATLWGGEPAGGVQPPMSVADAFHSENQERTYGTLAAPRFATDDDMYLNNMAAFQHHTLAYPIIQSNAGYLGWSDDNGSTIQIPSALNVAMVDTVFSWVERYQSYYLTTPTQDTDEPKLPRIDSFTLNSVVFDNEVIEINFNMGGYETHKANRDSDVIVSATTDGTDYLVALQYSTKDKPTCYYSFFTGTGSSLDSTVGVGENYIPVGVR